MRFGSYLRSVDALATAGALCSPILGTFKRDDLAADVVGAVDWGDLRGEHHKCVVLVVEGNQQIGYATTGDLLNRVLRTSDPLYVPLGGSIGDVLQRFVSDRVVAPDSCLTSILRLIESNQADLLLVGSIVPVCGSIVLDDLLKPPALIYLLCLSLELEGAALELCSLYPRSFFNLPTNRQDCARERFRLAKKKRNEVIDEVAEKFGERPHEEMLARELLQVTMMCDKKTMLTTAELGLTESKNKIRRVFKFFEEVRNYVAHPSASFTRDEEQADRLADADQERIDDDETWTLPITLAVADELGIKSAVNLATTVRECHELVADIDRAQGGRESR
jgi:hypothetical protein